VQTAKYWLVVGPLRTLLPRAIALLSFLWSIAFGRDRSVSQPNFSVAMMRVMRGLAFLGVTHCHALDFLDNRMDIVPLLDVVQATTFAYVSRS